MRVSKGATVALAFCFLSLVIFTNPAAGSDLRSSIPGFLIEEVIGAGGLLDDALGSANFTRPANPIFPIDTVAGNQGFQLFSVFGNELTSTFLFGVPPAPGLWSVESGAAVLSPDGLFQADVIGLAVDGFTAANTPVSAVIFCGDGRLVHATQFFFTDAFGDAFIDEDFVFLPDFCLDPAVIFVNESDLWIAATDSALGF